MREGGGGGGGGRRRGCCLWLLVFSNQSLFKGSVRVEDGATEMNAKQLFVFF